MISLLPVLSLVIAALAVFFGPIIQLSIAKKQIRASVLSANRQRWIDTLREQLAEFINTTSELKALSYMSVGGQALVDKTAKMQLLRTKISLMLNPLETDHQQLLTLIEVAATSVTKSGEEDKMDVPAIMALSKTILKREWERVKASQ